MTEKKKNPVGRPSKYSEKFIDQLYEFADRPLYENVIKEQLSNRGDIVEVSVERPNRIPTIEGFALHIRVNKSSVYLWAKEYPDFSTALEYLRHKTKEFVNYHALMGNYNGGYAKFFAINATDMKSTEHTVNDNKNVEITISGAESNL